MNGLVPEVGESDHEVDGSAAVTASAFLDLDNVGEWHLRLIQLGSDKDQALNWRW